MSGTLGQPAVNNIRIYAHYVRDVPCKSFCGGSRPWLEGKRTTQDADRPATETRRLRDHRREVTPRDEYVEISVPSVGRADRSTIRQSTVLAAGPTSVKT